MKHNSGRYGKCVKNVCNTIHIIIQIVVQILKILMQCQKELQMGSYLHENCQYLRCNKPRTTTAFNTQMKHNIGENCEWVNNTCETIRIFVQILVQILKILTQYQRERQMGANMAPKRETQLVPKNEGCPLQNT